MVIRPKSLKRLLTRIIVYFMEFFNLNSLFQNPTKILHICSIIEIYLVIVTIIFSDITVDASRAYPSGFSIKS